MSELSVQLYTVRDALAQDFDGTLSKLAAFGFTQVEPFAFVNFADELRSGLATNGLTAPTAHIHLLGEDHDAICELAAELGIQTIVEPYVDPARWQAEADIGEIASELNAVDTYWAYAGGADVPALLTRLGERVVALHIKDGDGTLDTSKQVPVGSGVVPVWDIIAAAPEALRVVELDDSEIDLLEAVRASREFLLADRA